MFPLFCACSLRVGNIFVTDLRYKQVHVCCFKTKISCLIEILTVVQVGGFSRTLLYVTFGLWHEPSVCRLCRLLSVCNVVAPYTETWTFQQYFCTPNTVVQGHGQFVLKFWAKIRSSSRGVCKLNTRGYEKLSFSINISLYIENGTRYCHSYNGRWIWTRRRSIECCHFQWPCMTLNPDFKGTPLFDVTYLYR